jgi:hypothetical protein
MDNFCIGYQFFLLIVPTFASINIINPEVGTDHIWIVPLFIQLNIVWMQYEKLCPGIFLLISKSKSSEKVGFGQNKVFLAQLK